MDLNDERTISRIKEIGERLKEYRRWNPIKHKRITIIERDRINKSEYSIDWTETLRISIRQRDRYTCKLCGKQQGDKAFSVHHIDYNKENCNPENLITLCQKCHSKTNYNREYWIDYFKIC